LRVALNPEEGCRLSAHPTTNPIAYEAFLHARQEFWKLTREGIDRAIQLTNQALSIVGDNALLQAALSYGHFCAYDAGFRHDEETLALVETCAAQALKLSPDLPQALFTKGLARYKKGDFPGFLRYLRRSIELERNSDALFFLAFGLAEAGSITEARGYADEALARDPLMWLTSLGRSVVDLLDGQFDAALARFRDWSKRWTPDQPLALWWLAQALAYAGQEGEAVAVFERTAKMDADLFSEMCELGARAFRGDRAGTRNGWK